MNKISAAHDNMGRHDIGAQKLNLCDAFGIGAEGAIMLNLHTSKANATANSEQFDTLEMLTPWDDWKKALKADLMTLIANGQYGAAMNLAHAHMTSFSEAHAEDTLKILDNALKSLANNGHQYQVTQFTSLAPDSALSNRITSMQSALETQIGGFLFMTSNPYGTDSPHADLNLGTHLEPAYEMHLKRQDGKPKQHMEQYLGIGNPKLRTL